MAAVPTEFNDANLKTTLMSQKLRAEQHRTNYETLKAQHILLQKDHNGIQIDYRTLLEQHEAMKSKCEDIISQLQSERDHKITECEELKSQVLTGQKLEVVKLKVAAEIEAPYKKQLHLMENELETFRSDYNKVRHSYCFLKAEHENMKAKHEVLMEETMARHEAEVSRYQEERRQLVSRLEGDVPGSVKNIRQLQRRNSELEQRVMGLEAELEECGHKGEQRSAQWDQTQRTLSRRVAEVEALNQSLQREQGILQEHNKRLQDEISEAHKQHLSLSEDVMAAQGETTTLHRQLDELAHSHRTAVSVLALGHSQQCDEMGSQRDSALAELESCRARIEVLGQAMQQQETSLAGMGREVEARVQAAKEQEWSKMVSLEQDRMGLEERLSEMQRQIASAALTQQSLSGKLREEVRQLECDKSGLEGELEVVRSQLQHQSTQCKSSQHELESLRTVQKKYQLLQTNHQRVEKTAQQLEVRCDKLQATIQLLEEQLGVVKAEGHRVTYEQAMAMDTQQRSWEEERVQLISKVNKSKDAQQSLQEKLTSTLDTSKKRHRHYRQRVGDLKRRLELSVAREEHVAMERDTVQKLLDTENHKMKRKYQEMQRRQKEFHFFLQQDHTQPLLLGQGTVQGVAQHQEHKKDLHEVRQRLEQVASETREHRKHLRDRSASITSDSLGSDHTHSLSL